MAKKNAINEFTTELTIDPGASGDSFVQFDINATGEFRIGVDDDDGDAFKISQGSALGTNDTFVMTSSGERTLPLQPAFAGYLSSTDSSITGNGATYTFGSGNSITEQYDIGSNFSTSTFTAPVTGKYLLQFNTKNGNLLGDGTATDATTSIVTSNRTWSIDIKTGGINSTAINLVVLADMDALDTATFTIVITGMNSDAANIQGNNSWISGALVT